MDLLTMHLLSAQRCVAITEELRNAAGGAATVYGRGEGGAVHSNIRKTTRLEPSRETRDLVRHAFVSVMEQLSSHFGRPVSVCEEPQFLRYQPGDYFVAHQDGNTPLIFDDSRHRKISAIVFLSRPLRDDDSGDFSGGELVFHGGPAEPSLRVPVAGEQGMLVAFPPELTHEVMPVVSGVRYSIATWYR